MIRKEQFTSTLFFDIETTTRYKTYAEYTEAEPFMAAEFLYRVGMKSEYKGMTVDDVYHDFGMLYPEHAQIVSIAWKIHDGDAFIGETIGFSSWEEYESKDNKYADRDILIKFNEVLRGLFDSREGTLGGYRIKQFDIPFVYKRMLINGLYPQASLITVGKKPWDLNHLELYDYWTGVGAAGMAGFGAICEVMGVGNPKEDGLDGRQVCYRFWDDHDVVSINEYCMKDVLASMKLAWSLTTDILTSKHNKTMEEWNADQEITEETQEKVEEVE